MKHTFKTIESQVLEKITPTEKDRNTIETVIKELIIHVEKEIKKTKIPITSTLVGSTAKDTYIRTGVDIDLFLLFSPTTSRETLQDIGLSIGRAILEDQEECFAEHPYIRGYYHGVKTEIVPSYKIESASQKLSAVDRTPLHTAYVKDHLKEEQKQDVRLLKQFLKGIGCYGAEAEIEGFSGYLCEILIIKYSTFHGFLTNAQTWKNGETLTLTSGKISSFETPLVFIDPVDENRNVASALSKEKFEIVIQAAAAYVKNPQLTFFFPNPIEPWSLQMIKQKIVTKEFLGICFKKPAIISENLYPQVRKAVRAITDLCTSYDFTIIDASFHITKTHVYIVLHPQASILSTTVLHEGPPLTLKKNAEEFLQKWSNHPRAIRQPFEKNKRWYVEITREYPDLRTLLKERLTLMSLGKHLDQAARKEFSLLEHDALLTNELRLFWTVWFDTRMSWER